jgi:hypothetical protein
VGTEGERNNGFLEGTNKFLCEGGSTLISEPKLRIDPLLCVLSSQSVLSGLHQMVRPCTNMEDNSRIPPRYLQYQPKKSSRTRSRRGNGVSLERTGTTLGGRRKVRLRSYLDWERVEITLDIVSLTVLPSERETKTRKESSISRDLDILVILDFSGHQDFLVSLSYSRYFAFGDKLTIQPPVQTTQGWSNQIERIYLNSMIRFDLGSKTMKNITSV